MESEALIDDGIPSNEETNASEPEPSDDTRIINPASGTCAVCGEPIVRLPGARGRAPKYHPDCRPSKQRASSKTPVTRVTVASKAAAERLASVDAIVGQFEGQVNKVILMLSLVEPYDALVIKVNLPDLLASMHAALMKSDKAFAIASAGETGASMLMMLLTAGAIVLPIGAHHGMLGKGKMANMILNIPVMMMRLNDASAQSETGDFTMELLNMARQRHAEKKRQAATDANRETTDGVS